MKLSWMVGDRETDILCGKAAGVKTILVGGTPSPRKKEKNPSNFKAENLFDGVRIIIENS